MLFVKCTQSEHEKSFFDLDDGSIFYILNEPNVFYLKVYIDEDFYSADAAVKLTKETDEDFSLWHVYSEEYFEGQPVAERNGMLEIEN